MSKQSKILELKAMLKPKVQQFVSIILDGKIFKRLPASHTSSIHVQTVEGANELIKLIENG